MLRHYSLSVSRFIYSLHIQCRNLYWRFQWTSLNFLLVQDWRLYRFVRTLLDPTARHGLLLLSALLTRQYGWLILHSHIWWVPLHLLVVLLARSHPTTVTVCLLSDLIQFLFGRYNLDKVKLHNLQIATAWIWAVFPLHLIEWLDPFDNLKDKFCGYP